MRLWQNVIYYKTIINAIDITLLLIKSFNLFIKNLLDKIGFICYTIYRIIKEVVIMTNKEKENLFWNCTHYGKIIFVNDYEFKAEGIYVSSYCIEYESKRHLFIKVNGVVVHYEEVKED